VRYPHLLQSTANGRYDILFAFPGDSLRLDNDGGLHLPGEAVSKTGDFLEQLDSWWRESRSSIGAAVDLPFSGGWFVFLAYELAGQIESSLNLPASNSALPVALATRFRTAVIVDHEKGNTCIVGEPGQQQFVEQIDADVRMMVSQPPNTDVQVQVENVREDEPQQYLDAVARIHDYIREGDVFQVNLSRSWRIQLEQTVTAAALFGNLGIHNPSPFSGLASWTDAAIIRNAW